MKKYLKTLLISSLVFTLLACDNNAFDSQSDILSSTSEEKYEEVDLEIKRTFNYFMNTTNLNEEADGYGLSLDRFTNRNVASIASTGFALAGYPVYVEEGLLTKEKAMAMAEGTIDTCLRLQKDPMQNYGGCLYHFVNSSSGKREWNCEISTIDTTLLVAGAIVAGEYFQGSVKTKAEQLWSNVDFNKFIVKDKGREHISMGVKGHDNLTQISAWSGYAEHLALYLIGIGNPNKSHRIDPKIYDNMTKPVSSYGEYEYVYSWFGSLFTYQFSHAFFNFGEYKDLDGTNWYENSTNASLAAYEYCQDYAEYYKSYGPNSWGLTACDTPLGYNGLLGTPARGYTPDERYMQIAGTVAPCAAIGSMPFTPELSLNALKYYQSMPKLNDESFGLRDSFNLDFNGHNWVDPDFVGIDKGISLLMLYNFKSNNKLANLGNSNSYIKEAYDLAGFIKEGA